MVAKADTKLSVAKKKVGKGRTYEAFTIYLPSILVTDSAFPFKPKDRLVVKIKGERLLIEKKKSKSTKR
ncbi:MAG: hypothetical protein ACUVTL_09295 [Thermoproteota archaeon]